MNFDVVCVDGSFNESAGRAGMGWVIVKDRKLDAGNKYEETGKIRKGVAYSEFKAAALGLKALRRQGVRPLARLIMDNGEVYSFTQKSREARLEYISVLDESRFKQSVIDLNNMLDEIPDLVILIISPKNRKNGPLKKIANMAHNASCLASGAGSLKETDFTKPKRRPLREDRGSTPSANEVIDHNEDDGSDLKSGPMPVFD